MPSQQLLYRQEFLDHLQHQKRYSPNTITSYESDLIAFTDFLEIDYAGVDNITQFIIKSWLAQLKEQKQSSRSVNRKISTLKSYFKYLLKKGYIINSPMGTVASLKVSKRLPNSIEEKDINILFQHVEFPDTWEGKTDRLLLEILYNTGIRVSELVGLKETHIDRSNSNIKVLGKGNKERIIPVSTDIIQKLFVYINEKRNLADGFNTVEILVNEKGVKLTRHAVYKVVTNYLSMVTTNKKKSPHVLRHSFATHLTNNGADINAIKELLGHTSLAATQIYTSNTIERLKDIHKKAHPKA